MYGLVDMAQVALSDKMVLSRLKLSKLIVGLCIVFTFGLPTNEDVVTPDKCVFDEAGWRFNIGDSSSTPSSFHQTLYISISIVVIITSL